MLHSYQLPYQYKHQVGCNCCQSIPLQHPRRLPARQLPRPRFPDHGALWQGVSNRLRGHVSTRRKLGLGGCIKTHQNHSETVGMISLVPHVKMEVRWLALTLELHKVYNGCVYMTVYSLHTSSPWLDHVGICWNAGNTPLHDERILKDWSAEGTATEFPSQWLNAL